jgi:putative membrane protein
MSSNRLPKHIPDNRATNLALDRTFLAHERTLMAWVRTSASLISFGFSIYKFFQYLSQSQGVMPYRRFGPREFAAGMISLGIVTLVFATLQHRRDIKRMELEYGRVYRSLTVKLAAMLSLIGVLLLFVVLLRY